MGSNPLKIGVEVNVGDLSKLTEASQKVASSVASMSAQFSSGSASAKEIAAASQALATSLVASSGGIQKQTTSLINLQTALAAAKAALKETAAIIIEEGGSANVGASMMRQLAVETQQVAILQTAVAAASKEAAGSLISLSAAQATAASTAAQQAQAAEAAAISAAQLAGAQQLAADTAAAEAAANEGMVSSDVELAAAEEAAGAAFIANRAALRERNLAAVQAGPISEAASTATTRMAQSFMASGLTAKEATTALVGMGFSAKEVAATMAELGFAEGAVTAETEGATVALGAVERQLANIDARLIGQMIPGMGMLGYQVGRLAGLLPGLGQLFIYALPVALVGFAVEQWEKFQEEVAKAARQSEEFAAASYKVADSIELENLRLQDQIEKLEHHPERNTMREALIEDKAAAEELSKSLAEAIEKSIDLLKVGAIGALFAAANANEEAIKTKLQPVLDALTESYAKLAAAPPGSDMQKAAIQEQIQLYHQLHTAASEQINLLKEAESPKPYLNTFAGMPGQQLQTQPDKQDYSGTIAKLKNLRESADESGKALEEMDKHGSLLQTEAGLQVADTHYKAIGDQVGKFAELNTEINDAKAKLQELQQQPILNASAIAGTKETIKALSDELWKGMAPGAAKEAEAISHNQEMWRKLTAEQIAEAKRAQEEKEKIEREGASQTSERMNRIMEEQTENNIRNAQNDVRRVNEARESADVGKVGIFKEVADVDSAKAGMAALSGTIDHLKSDITALNAQPFLSESDQKNLEKYQTELLKVEQEFTKLQREAPSIMQQIGESMQQAATQGFQAFNTNFIRMLEGGETFVHVMQHLWTSMVTTIITSILQMGEKWVVQHVIMAAAQKVMELTGVATHAAATTAKIAEDKAQGLADVGLAGAGGVASMAAAPFPIDLLAPAFGASMAAAAASFLAFEEGGIVPGAVGSGVPILAHAGEAVIPQKLTAMLQSAATGRGVSDAGGNAGHSINVTYSPTIHAIDTRGVSDMLREHGEQFTSHFMSELRKRNVA